MLDQPHWLVQELAGEAVWTALALGAALVWKNREEIAQRLRRPRHITRTVTDRLGLTDTVTPTAGIQAQILYHVYGLAGAERQILYNVKAPKP